jgi:acyl dehydratase
MPIDYERLRNWQFQDVERILTTRDTMLYALGIGVGNDPVDPKQLRFVYEENLVALPTMATVIAGPGFWLRDPRTGVDWVNVLHGEQSVTLHEVLPPEGRIIGRTRVVDVIDKGPDKGAVIMTERELFNADRGAKIATLSSTTLARKDGGFGGPRGPTAPPHAIPDRAADVICDLPTLPQAALIFRLSGDYNPLHADPDLARRAGYQAPILHGLCTFGVAGHAILRTVCDYQADRLAFMQARFSAPLYPGETVRAEIWCDGADLSFRARSLHRDVIVLNNGRARLRV